MTTAQEIYLRFSLVLEPLEEVVKGLRQLYFQAGEQDWPSYCYFPLKKWLSVIKTELNPSDPVTEDLEVFWYSTLIHWHINQHVWTVSETMLTDERFDASPLDFVYELPHWGLYLDLSGFETYFSSTLTASEVKGAFVCLNVYKDLPVLIVVFVAQSEECPSDILPFYLPLKIDGATVGSTHDGLPDDMAGWFIKIKRILASKYYSAIWAEKRQVTC